MGTSSPSKLKYAVPLTFRSIIPSELIIDEIAGVKLIFSKFCKTTISFVWPGSIVASISLIPVPIDIPLMKRSYEISGMYTGKNPLLLKPNIRFRLIPLIKSNPASNKFPPRTFSPALRRVESDNGSHSMLWRFTSFRLTWIWL